MTDQDKNQLLENILGDDELNRLRRASLSRGLQEMRRRRRRAMAARLSLMALPALLLAVAALYPRLPQPHQASVPKAMVVASTAASKVEYINTEQFFALFPNRPMALVGKPGQQQVMFLDGHPADGQ
jgi:hypothetical protein